MCGAVEKLEDKEGYEDKKGNARECVEDRGDEGMEEEEEVGEDGEYG